MHKISPMFLNAGAEERTENDDAEVARLIETLALRSVRERPKKEYFSKWKTWVQERASSNSKPVDFGGRWGR